MDGKKKAVKHEDCVVTESEPKERCKYNNIQDGTLQGHLTQSDFVFTLAISQEGPRNWQNDYHFNASRHVIKYTKPHSIPNLPPELIH